MLQRPRLLVPAAACLLALSAEAQPPMASQLRSDCKAWALDSDRADAARCADYIHGFLDGAVVARGRIVLNEPGGSEAGGGFAERAFRTRVRDRTELDPAAYASVCLADPVPVGEVIAAVNAHLDAEPPAADETAAGALYAALRAGFPCKKPGS